LLAFVISSALTALAGALFAYYRGFVSKADTYRESCLQDN
jgi:ABC-type branched-subunit amino acid transport system permease subunit